MDTIEKVKHFLRQQSKQKLLAKIALVCGTLATLLQFFYIRQNSYTLDSVIIPKTMIWEVNKQFVLFALVLTVGNFIGLILYFFERYLWTVAIIFICLLAIRYVYI